VLDAHDEQAISGASVEICLPAFDREDVPRRALSDADGKFRLDALQTPRPEGALLRVRARWHATLVHPLPADGQVRVHLTAIRRALLERLVSWAGLRGAPYPAGRAPTPGEVVGIAERHEQPSVAEWAREIERAAYGASAPDRELARDIERREPK
jgi:hypothetical protein